MSEYCAEDSLGHACTFSCCNGRNKSNSGTGNDVYISGHILLSGPSMKRGQFIIPNPLPYNQKRKKLSIGTKQCFIRGQNKICPEI